MRLLVPLVLIAAGIGLFALYTNPTYQELKALGAEVAQYDEALNNAQALRGLRDKLLSERRAFPTEAEQKLTRVLPDNVDNIRLIIDINNIAARHNLSLRNVALGDVSSGSKDRAALAVGQSGEKIGSVSLGFTLSASYEQFLAFLRDLEHSLRLIDVEKISFKPDGKTEYDYTVAIRTYWLH